jgi:hypothetical protein
VRVLPSVSRALTTSSRVPAVDVSIVAGPSQAATPLGSVQVNTAAALSPRA